jgi:hypothetical protein
VIVPVTARCSGLDVPDQTGLFYDKSVHVDSPFLFKQKTTFLCVSPGDDLVFYLSFNTTNALPY